MSALSSLSELRQEFRWQRLLPGLSAGVIIGIVEVVLAISFAALVFSGPLRPFLVNGIGITLIGAVLSGASVALFTSAPGTVAGNQDIPAAVMAVSAGAIALTIPAAAPEGSLYATVVVMIALITALTGIFFSALARFRAGKIVYYLPYPVIRGFLAATGWVLLLGGIGIMVDVTPAVENLAFLVQPAQMMRWAPGMLLAGTLMVGMRRSGSAMAMPAMLFGGVALFYAAAMLAGIPVGTLLAEDWLLGPLPQQSLWQAPPYSQVALVHWPSIAGQILNIVTLVLMSTIALLLNGSGLEIIIGKDIELDTELHAAGIGNILAGAAGGLVGFQQLSLSTIGHRVGKGNRLAGLFAAAFCALILLMGASVLSLFPKVVLGALVSYLGLSFLRDTVVTDWSALPRGDYAVMMLILLVAATIGFVEAVGVGLLLAVILFVISYSRIEIVRDELAGGAFQSRVTRSPQVCRVLAEHGKQVHIMRLQGFIFFGTSDSLINRIRQRLTDPELTPLRFLLLDFNHVTGIDTTTVLSFVKLVRLVTQHGVKLVLTEPLPGLRQQIGAKIPTEGVVFEFDNLDRGLEWCEEETLTHAGLVRGGGDGLQQELKRHLGQDGDVARLLTYFERRVLEAGQYLMRQGDVADTLYLVESGHMSAYLEEKNGQKVRLQAMQEWNVLGEIGFFLDKARTASVVAEAPAVVYCLSKDSLAHMCRQDPGLSSALHRLIVELLSERVVHLMSVVDAQRG